MRVSFSVTKRALLISGGALILATTATTAVLGFLQVQDLSRRLTETNRQLTRLSTAVETADVTQLGELASTVGEIQTTTVDLTTDSERIVKTVDRLNNRLKIYDECIPELQQFAGSASGFWYNDGTVTVFSDATISRYCDDLLYGTEEEQGE